MRVIVACFTVLGLVSSARAFDVQPGDTVMAYDGIGCFTWEAYQKVTALEDHEGHIPKGTLPSGCLFVRDFGHFVVESVKGESDAICMRNMVLPNCLWFPVDRVLNKLRAGQQRT